MSDNSFWETKYLNSEKSIEFLRQTHSEVLKGLHDEIDRLQKQCSGIYTSNIDLKFYTFKLSFIKLFFSRICLKIVPSSTYSH